MVNIKSSYISIWRALLDISKLSKFQRSSCESNLDCAVIPGHQAGLCLPRSSILCLLSFHSKFANSHKWQSTSSLTRDQSWILDWDKWSWLVAATLEFWHFRNLSKVMTGKNCHQWGIPALKKSSKTFMACFADMAWHGMASWHWIGPSEYYAIPQWCKVCFENLRIIFKRKRGKRIHKLRLSGKSFIFYFDASPFIHQNNFPPKFNCESCYWQSTDRHCLLFWNAAKFLVSLFQTNFCQFVAILTSKGFHHSQNLKK